VNHNYKYEETTGGYMFIGLLIILVGVLMLFDHLGFLPGDVWDYFVPLALIALGVSMVFRDKHEKHVK